MIFNSFSFIFFLTLVLISYWNFNLKNRLLLIFFSSLIFYGFWKIEFIPILLFSIFIDFFASKKIYNTKSKKVKKKIFNLKYIY